MRQRVVVVVPAGGSMFEIATPLRVWGPDPSEPDWPDVDVSACAVDAGPLRLATSALTVHGLAPLAEHAARADMIVVPTWPVDARPADPALLDALRVAHARGARIVGLCLGAFVLAEAGLLDGARAVTHWRYAEELARRFPAVAVESAPLYLDLGSVVTSAGSAAALDCCLHLVRRDHGAEAAAIVARSLVTAPHRGGGQAQFAAAKPLSPGDDLIGGLLGLAGGGLREIRSVADLVERSGVPRRSLERLFRARLGVTPQRWLREQRIGEARRMLETGDCSVEKIAEAVGFGSAQAFRHWFGAAVGVAPTAYRRSYRGTEPPEDLPRGVRRCDPTKWSRVVS